MNITETALHGSKRRHITKMLDDDLLLYRINSNDINICLKIIDICFSKFKCYMDEPYISDSLLLSLFYIHKTCVRGERLFSIKGFVNDISNLAIILQKSYEHELLHELLDDIITEVCRIKV